MGWLFKSLHLMMMVNVVNLKNVHSLEPEHAEDPMAARGHVVHRPLLLLLLLLFTALADQEFKRAWRSWSIRWRSMRKCFFTNFWRPLHWSRVSSGAAASLQRIRSYYLYSLIFWLESVAAYLLIRIKQSTILDISFSCKASIKNCCCVGKVRMK